MPDKGNKCMGYVAGLEGFVGLHLYIYNGLFCLPVRLALSTNAVQHTKCSVHSARHIL